ncbi:MAG: molybdopterin-dependent oxidoreductase [Oscillospiraceae bacterium]|nr:molybdopterin-dependent oxidoreductase [Oscillospiraceae bacterium]
MTLIVNGVTRILMCDPEKDSLADVLRRIGLAGVKIGCGKGVCGACSVILDGKVIRSCARKAASVKDYSKITTIEGIGSPSHLHPLQVAWMNSGALQCGFCSPGFIVSAYALLQENPNPTREEVRDWFQKHRNICRCTGYKQIVDAVMNAAKVMRGEATLEEISFPEPEDGELYGKPMVRPLALGKVTGLLDYGDDIGLHMPPGTLHVAVVQPKITHHANILGIDFSEAEKVPGVKRFLTYKDVKGTNHLRLCQANVRSTTTEPSHVILCEDKIYRYGDVVALVVADTQAHAREAAAKVKVEIEQLPEYLNYLDAVAPGAMRIHSDTDNLLTFQPVLKGAGLERARNVSDIIDQSAYQVSGSFYSSREPHLSIEPDPMQAYYDEDGLLTIQCKAQGVYTERWHLAECLGIEEEKLRLVMNNNGASFGWATNAGSDALIGIAAMAMGVPVTMSMSYEEHQALSGKRSPAFSNARLACDKDGHITAAEFDVGIDHGAFNDDEGVIDRSARFAWFGYKIPHLAAMVRIANTNHAFGTAYRSFGSPQVMTFSEALVDMLAEKVGLDPFEFRRRNIPHPGDTNINSYLYRDYPWEQMLDVMKPIYDKAVADARAADTPEKRRGVGIALGGYNVTDGATAAYVDDATVALELNPDGTITKYDTWEEMGQGGDVGSLHETLEALKPLGITRDMVQLIQSDSKFCPNTGMSGSSRQHYLGGLATIGAANKLMDAMRKEDGTFRTYQEMVAEGIPTKYEHTYACDEFVDPRTGLPLCGLDPNTGIGDPTAAFTYAFFLAEVEVDTATGKVTCIGFTCVDDVGVIGDRVSVDGQAYGGISHGIGFALSENYDDVKKHANMAGAGVPGIKDIPDNFHIYHVENPRMEGPWGSSGASEAFQSDPHMAVINAIYDACKVRIYDLPATPDKIKAGLKIVAAGGRTEPPAPYNLGGDLYADLENVQANPI